MVKSLLVTILCISLLTLVSKSADAQTCTDTVTGDVVCVNFMNAEIDRSHCQDRLGNAPQPLSKTCVVDCPEPPEEPPPISSDPEPEDEVVECNKTSKSIAVSRAYNPGESRGDSSGTTSDAKRSAELSCNKEKEGKLTFTKVEDNDTGVIVKATCDFKC